MKHLFATLALLPFFGCATTMTEASNVSLAGVDYPKAQALLESSLDAADPVWGWKTEYQINNVEFLPAGIQITAQRKMISSLGPIVSCHIVYDKLKGLEMLATGGFTMYVWPLETGCENLFPHWTGNGAAQHANDFLKALLAMQRLGPSAYEDYERREAARKAEYEKYKNMNPKPPIPEEARRFKVQAEAAFDEKQYAQAAGYYAQGLEIAPWWPEGHYNRALMLEQISRYQEAMDEMKLYLELAPDSPTARKAQDKIYVWETKVPAGGKRGLKWVKPGASPSLAPAPASEAAPQPLPSK
jgi:tetratricopeptide (TPR) repeat protein